MEWIPLMNSKREKERKNIISMRRSKFLSHVEGRETGAPLNVSSAFRKIKQAQLGRAKVYNAQVELQCFSAMVG